MTDKISEYNKANLKEYLRRNHLHCSSVGVTAGAIAGRKRLMENRRPSKWLIEKFDEIIERALRVEAEMAKHRDEIDISDFYEYCRRPWHGG